MPQFPWALQAGHHRWPDSSSGPAWTGPGQSRTELCRNRPSSCWPSCQNLLTSKSGQHLPQNIIWFSDVSCEDCGSQILLQRGLSPVSGSGGWDLNSPPTPSPSPNLHFFGHSNSYLMPYKFRSPPKISLGRVLVFSLYMNHCTERMSPPTLSGGQAATTRMIRTTGAIHWPFAALCRPALHQPPRQAQPAFQVRKPRWKRLRAFQAQVCFH